MPEKLYKRTLILLLLALLFITQAATDIYVAGLPIMAREFGVSPGTMNMTITVYVYTQAFLFLVVGMISDVLGRRKTILLGLIISLIATFIISESKTLDIIIIFRIFQAAGSAVVYIVSRLIIKEVYAKDEVLKVTSLFLIGLVLSPALAPVVGAYIIHYFDWRWCFRFNGIMLAIFLICGTFIIRESNQKIQEYRADFLLSKILNNYLTVLSNSVFIKNVIVVGGTFAAFYAFISMSSYMFINEYHISSIYYSYLFTFIAIGYLIGNKIMTYLNSKNVTPYALVKIGIIIASIVTIATIVSIFFRSNLYVFIVLVTLAGWLTRVATAFINPPIQVGVLHMFPHQSSYAVGLLSCLQYIFAAFGSWFVGVIPSEPSISIIISTIVFSGLTILCFCTMKPEDLK